MRLRRRAAQVKVQIETVLMQVLPKGREALADDWVQVAHFASIR